MSIFRKKASLTAVSALISLYTLVAFHAPFFKHELDCINGGANGVILIASTVLLLLAINFFFTYLILYLGRFVGKCIVSFFLVGNAIGLYFINNFNALITDKMMGNVIHTQYSEVSGFFCWAFVLYILLLGVPPCIYLFARKIEYGSWKRFFANLGVALGLILAGVFGNMKNWPWIDRNSTELGSLLLPWSYTVNTYRYLQWEKKKNVKEILLPDARFTTDSRDVCVLIIGESTRRDHCSLYGYLKETNPYTSKDGVKAYVADASATYTLAGVRAILEPKETKELYEILPNYLGRTGADIIWRTSNWGEPPVKYGKYLKKGALAKLYPEEDSKHDGILFHGLKEEIEACESNKQFIVIHTYTNHGPAYYSNYPPEFEIFTPVCTTVEMSQATQEEVFNAYDNSVVYTDWLVHNTIQMLKDMPDTRGMVLFVSDHGESLGENNLYMHGVPMAIAPREQIEIPFIVWTSAQDLEYKDLPEVGQHHVYHSVLHFFGMETPAYNPQLDIFQ